jgi:hypothetical protein
MKLLRRIEVEEELRIIKKGVLNIQLLVIRLLPHSSSFSECAKGKAYNEKIYFAQMIIQDIDTTITFVVEFLRKSKRRWHAKEQIRPRATSIDLMCIKVSEEDETKEQHFVEAYIV